MAAPIPGQTFEVRARLANRGRMAIGPTEVRVETLTGWQASPAAGQPALPEVLNGHEVLNRRFAVAVEADAPLSTRPSFRRRGLQESRYALDDLASFGRAASPAPLVAAVVYVVEGRPVTLREVVRRREPKLPYGDVLREVRSVPRLGVTVSPTTAVVPLAAATKRVELQVDVVHNAEAASTGTRLADAARRLEGRAGEPSADASPAPASGPASASRSRPSTLDAKPYARRGRGHGRGPQLSRRLRAHRPARPRAAAISIARPPSRCAAST